MTIPFAVDPVERAAAPAETVPAGELIGACLALGLPAELRVLPLRDVHPLLAAVHHAFLEHRPLVLSPDAVWLTIAGGVAHHVRLHAEALRPRLVRHLGRKTLEVKVEVSPESPEAWGQIVDAFRASIADEIGDGLARLFTCDFTTSGAAERIASEIVLMDATSPYFVFLVTIVCGIPEITLTGTPADWRAIRARIDVIAELGLEFWTASLAPIVDRLIAAAEGEPDVAFFRDIYKPEEAYGWDRITGWIARLYPYVRDAHGSHSKHNPLLAFPLDGPLPPASDPVFYDGPGITSSDPPPGPSRAVVLVHDLRTDLRREHVLEGGLLVVEQDAEGRLVPRAGWAVRAAGCGPDAVIERLRREHHVIERDVRRKPVAPADPSGMDDEPIRFETMEDTILFETVQEAVLFSGAEAWRLLPPEARELVEVVPGTEWQRVEVLRVVDLPDGGFLALARASDRPAVVQMRRSMPIAEIPVVGDSLVAVLQQALESGGAPPEPSGTVLLDLASRYWDSRDHAAALLERLRAGGHSIKLGKSFEADDRGKLADALVAELQIGQGIWKFEGRREWRQVLFENPPEGRRFDIVADLGDGTVLAHGGFMEEVFVQLRTDRMTERVVRPAKGKRPAVLGLHSDQPLDEIPVIGRSLVDILTHALDLGRLPPPHRIGLTSRRSLGPRP